ncbi:MAG: serine hydrolase [Ignavibacteriales bacterium]|nr:serine hydrolase [Ignavibacteriales bacterium]
MKKRLSIAFVMTIPFIFFHCGTSGPFTSSLVDDPVMVDSLRAFASTVRGDVGIYVRNLKTGQTAGFNSDTLFPTASLIKVPIMVGLFDRIEKGGIAYQTDMMYRDSMCYPGEDDILGSCRDSAKIVLSKLVMLMQTMSDNTASLWCQALVFTRPV